MEDPSLAPAEVWAQVVDEGLAEDLGFDPRPSLAPMNKPGLWIYGARDRDGGRPPHPSGRPYFPQANLRT